MNNIHNVKEILKYIFLILVLLVIILVLIIPDNEDEINTDEEKEIAAIAKDIYFLKKLNKECGIVKSTPIAISLVSSNIYSVKSMVDIRNCPDADKWEKHCIYILVDNSTRKEYPLVGTQVEAEDCKKNIISEEDKNKIYSLLMRAIDKI